jgi:hypothetical protein
MSSAGVKISASVFAFGGGDDEGTTGGGKVARTLAKETWVDGRGSTTLLSDRSWLTWREGRGRRVEVSFASC